MRKGLVLAISSAITTGLAFFPFTGHPFFVLIGLSPLLLGIAKKEIKPKDFFIWGMVFYGITLYWIVRTVKHYGYTTYPIAIVAYVLLVIYLSLYPLIIGLVTVKAKKPALTFISLYPLSEWLRSNLFGGFPLLVLSHALSDTPLLLQSASYIGQYGISFLVLLVNYGFTLLLMGERKGIFHIALSLLIASLPTFERTNLEDKTLRIAIVQPNIGEEEKWNPLTKYENIEKLTNMIKIACSYNPDIIVTPETTYPIFFGKDPIGSKILEELKNCDSYIILGAIDYKDKAGKRLYLNKALNVYRGNILEEYTKNILVPFGEYVPLREILTKIIKNVSWPEDFDSGKELKIFNVKSLPAITPICFEICFPEYIAQGQKSLIISLTNDMWFGRTIAPYLHLWAAIPRSIENRSYIIRSANTGISAIVDPKGKTTLKTDLFAQTISLADIKRPITPKTTYQDFPYVTQLLLAILALKGIGGKRIGYKRITF